MSLRWVSHNNTQPNTDGECHYAGRRFFDIIILSANILSVVILNIIMLGVIVRRTGLIE